MANRASILGLGAMGTAMRDRLVECGFDVVGFRRSVASPSLAEAAAHGDVVIVMVSDDVALLDVVDRAATHARAGTLFIDMGTSGASAAREAHLRATRAGHAFIDVPVSGTIGPARKGALLGFAGGDDASIARAKPILDALCRRVIRAGAVGQGQVLKVVLNGIGAHHLVAFSSMLALGERAGLARESLVDAFTDGAFASPSYVGKKARVLERRYDAPEFSLRLTKKDARLARELAREVALDLPALAAVEGEVLRGVDAGLGEEDLFALEKVYPRLTDG
ncbi:hypothetical protein BH09MYX1_BH09MYX1_23630 [soil metagenome]